MILCDTQITALCRDGMVTPFNPALVNPASLDVRLGPTLLVEQATDAAMVPLSIADTTQDNPFLMRPSWFVLGETMETFNLPTCVAAQFMLKSSRAREGLEHLMAGYCDPGWCGSKLTMELHNSRQLHPVAIWHGMKIGQMVFHQMASMPERSYAVTGRYNNHDRVTASLG